MSEYYQSHVVVPARPATDLVVVHSQMVLRLLKAGFDGPAHGAQPTQLRKRSVLRRAAEIVLDLSGIRVATQEKPSGFSHPLALPTSADLDNPKSGYVSHQRPVGSFFQFHLIGPVQRNLPLDISCFKDLLVKIPRVRTIALSGVRDRQEPGGRWHFDKEVDSIRETVQEVGILAEFLVAQEPTKGQLAALMEVLDPPECGKPPIAPA